MSWWMFCARSFRTLKWLLQTKIYTHTHTKKVAPARGNVKKKQGTRIMEHGSLFLYHSFEIFLNILCVVSPPADVRQSSDKCETCTFTIYQNQTLEFRCSLSVEIVILFCLSDCQRSGVLAQCHVVFGAHKWSTSKTICKMHFFCCPTVPSKFN